MFSEKNLRPKGGAAPQVRPFTVGELADLLPPEFVRLEGIEPSREVSLDLTRARASLVEGRPVLRLSEIYRACPEMFQRPVGSGDDFEVRLPAGRVRALLDEEAGTESGSAPKELVPTPGEAGMQGAPGPAPLKRPPLPRPPVPPVQPKPPSPPAPEEPAVADEGPGPEKDGQGPEKPLPASESPREPQAGKPKPPDNGEGTATEKDETRKAGEAPEEEKDADEDGTEAPFIIDTGIEAAAPRDRDGPQATAQPFKPVQPAEPFTVPRVGSENPLPPSAFVPPTPGTPSPTAPSLAQAVSGSASTEGGESDLRQLELRAAFGYSGLLDADGVFGLAGELDGVRACAFFRGDKLVNQHSPGGGSLASLPEVFRNLSRLAHELGLENARNLVLQTDGGLIAFLREGEACLAVQHEGRHFAPGVRERLILILRELAKD